MNLQKLKNCQSIEDLIFSFSINTMPRKFAYIVYKIPDNQKYIEFEIKKSNGSPRRIASPKPPLKVLQRLFANIILSCISEIQQKNNKFLSTNHGFEKYKSIISNARVHQGKKYLLNIDIKDFFESIHFGRIKGYLVNDQHFQLHNKTAEIIATLATMERKKLYHKVHHYHLYYLY
ncbi:reverse transcriptase domain-containing protein [Pasteurella multocida]|uniref:reverse transcriptase domain-containing protein n=1 Tax=Pasteurella multocida TaxID=747 RepID=UPI0024C284F5|nr:reverse transcriptase domain-containing protein [Pasteurella multocida]